MSNPNSDLTATVRDGIARTIGAIGLAGLALIHTVDAPTHLVGGSDTWLGIAYIALITASLLLAASLILGGDTRVWAAAGLLVLATAIGFVLSRTTGLPGDSGDVGNWGENLGIASLFVDGTFLMLAVGVLGTRWATSRSARPAARVAAERRRERRMVPA